jgi:hypothetical protein
MTVKSTVDIINETVEYYKTNDRGVVDINGKIAECVYYKKEKDKIKMCAIGRCLKEPSNLEGVTMGLYNVFGSHVDYYLKEEYKGHNFIFWRVIQHFHDHPHYWEKSGDGWVLTDKGKQRYQELLESWIS